MLLLILLLLLLLQIRQRPELMITVSEASGHPDRSAAGSRCFLQGPLDERRSDIYGKGVMWLLPLTTAGATVAVVGSSPFSSLSR